MAGSLTHLVLKTFPFLSRILAWALRMASFVKSMKWPKIVTFLPCCGHFQKVPFTVFICFTVLRVWLIEIFWPLCDILGCYLQSIWDICGYLSVTWPQIFNSYPCHGTFQITIFAKKMLFITYTMPRFKYVL